MGQGNIVSSLLSTALRPITGINSEPAAVKPERLLQLYDIENCPYCRLVREVLTELDIDVEIYPCPKLGERYRPELIERAGKAQYPYLIDPNTGEELYESLDIIAYLFEFYAMRPLPLKWRLGKLQTAGSMLASAPRTTQGMKAKTGVQPKLMLELYSFESSPYARVVREMLCEMEIAYVVRQCGRTQWREWMLPVVRSALKISPDSLIDNRRKLQTEEGSISIPFLYDPNTGVGMFESGDIVEYLRENYS
jgi:glutaredoxin